MEAAEFGFGVVLSWGQGISGGGIAKEEPVDKLVEGLDGGRELRAGAFGIGVFGEGVSEFEGVLAELPVAEAVLGPVVEVLFGDGFGLEVFGEDGLDFGEGVEPREDGLVGFGIVETAVDLVAEGAREASDFSEHRFDGVFWICAQMTNDVMSAEGCPKPVRGNSAQAMGRELLKRHFGQSKICPKRGVQIVGRTIGVSGRNETDGNYGMDGNYGTDNYAESL
jgi:hypothetical protein